MINLRFHLVSLVAVFLALGVGVTMGASFVNRATVDTLRNRVDALETSYKDRGDLLEQIGAQLRQTDGSAEALVGPRSPVLPGLLSRRAVVEVVPVGLPRGVLDATEQALKTAGATVAGTLELGTALALEDAAVADRVRADLDLAATTPAALRREVLRELGGALAVLSAEVPTGTPPTTALVRPGGPTPDLVAVAEARRVVRSVVDLGLVALDTTDAAAGAAAPDVGGVTYVMVVSTDADDEVNDAVVGLATEVARAAPASVTVAEASALRAPGAVTTSTEVPDAELLGALRTDPDLAAAVSTVDDLEEPFGRLALVLAVEQEARGLVGHYGNGPGATAPFPLGAS